MIKAHDRPTPTFTALTVKYSTYILRILLNSMVKFVLHCMQVMEGLVAKGLTRAIGISNFSITKTEALLKTAKIVPAVNQVECHPYFQQPKLREYCSRKGHTSTRDLPPLLSHITYFLSFPFTRTYTHIHTHTHTHTVLQV